MPGGELLGIPSHWVLILSACLFAIGTLGVLLRRNAIAIFLSLELMLNAANVALAAFAAEFAAREGLVEAALTGQVFIFFVIGIAAAEAAVGLALFIAVDRLEGSLEVDRLDILRW